MINQHTLPLQVFFISKLETGVLLVSYHGVCAIAVEFEHFVGEPMCAQGSVICALQMERFLGKGLGGWFPILMHCLSSFVKLFLSFNFLLIPYTKANTYCIR